MNGEHQEQISILKVELKYLKDEVFEIRSLIKEITTDLKFLAAQENRRQGAVRFGLVLVGIFGGLVGTGCTLLFKAITGV